MSVRVSVIVPVYNVEKYLRECFDSLAAAVNFNEMEVIAVDDGSVDGSAAICDEYAARYQNFKVIHQQNEGVSAARNAGLAVASGEFIGFSDGDDYVHPEIYKAMLDSADKCGADMAVCCYEKEFQGQVIVYHMDFGGKGSYRGDEIVDNIVYRTMESHYFNNVVNKIFSSKIIKDNNIVFPCGKKYGEDRDFVIRFLSFAGCVSFSDYVGYFYREVNSGATNKARNNYVDTLLAQYHADLQSFSEFGIDRSVIEEKCGVALVKNYISVFWIIDQRTGGREKLELFRSVMENAEMTELFLQWYDKTFESEFKYNRNIMKAVRNKNVFMVNRSIRIQKLSERFKIAASRLVGRFKKTGDF